jgi:ribonuclease HI
MSFYAVANGRTNGIFSSWTKCNESIKGFPKAKYKKFTTIDQAEEFIQCYQDTIRQTPTKILFSPITPNMVYWGGEGDSFIADYYVYTDGACSNNGRENAKAGIGIFFGVNDTRNVSQPVVGKQTNNVAELIALIETYPIISKDIEKGLQIAIVSDSEYAIKSATVYGKKYDAIDWEINIPNKALVNRLYTLYKNLPNIQFIHIRAHTNNTDIHSFGNYNADKLANLAVHTIYTL